MPFSANHEVMEFTEQLPCFHKPIAVNIKSKTNYVTYFEKAKWHNETQSKTNTTLGFFQ